MAQKLTPEQAEIVEFTRSGHNVLITGQAGAGKSTVVNTIRKDCNQRGLKVGVVCSSGIACKVYEKGIASTIHSYYGLGAADRPSEQVIQFALGNNKVCERLKTLDVLILDEASMSSARILELMNALQHHLALEERLEKVPFAGKQIIIVGEFLQLRPVPSCHDAGEFMFHSKVFQHAIAHRFELTKLMRQSESDKQFVHAIKDLRMGKCSEETVSFMSTLSRELEPDLSERATNIFFKRNSVLLFNRSALDHLPGEKVRLDATFEGSGKKMKWPGESTLFLKKSCKVMLVWNKSETLKNGSLGTFEGIVHDGNELQICFEEVGTVNIDRETWVQRNRQGAKIGSVCQFPVVLAYAVTCHKAQGLELPAVVVHSSKEFVPGLTYVATSRVKSADTLQVTGFKPNQILEADGEVIQQCRRDAGEKDPSLACCRMRPVPDETFFEVRDRFLPDPETPDDCVYQFPLELSDGMVHAYFEREDDNIHVNCAQLYDQIQRHESELSRPPPEVLDTVSMLSQLKVKTERSDFSQRKNVAIEMLLQEENAEKVNAFINVVWFHSFMEFEKQIVNNPDEIVSCDFAKSDFTTATAKLHELYLSPEFSRYLSCLYSTSTCTAAQRSVGVQLSTATYWTFLHHLQTIVVSDRRQEVIPFKVEEMIAAGRAKVRHVGGWAIRKVLEKSRKYVHANIQSDNMETLESVKMHHKMCELIEESLIASFAKLEQESQHKETLQVTEARQFRERGLIHIEDAVYEFFLVLESYRVNLVNDQTMRREGANMVEVAHKEMMANRELKLKWQACFDAESLIEDKEGLIDMILKSVILRYINMGTAQYLRDFRRSYDLKKSAELRKRVLQRQQKNQEKIDIIPFKEILTDRTQGKSFSHERLTRFVEKYSDPSVLSRAYIRVNLVALCEAYGVGFRRNTTKKNLASSLVEAIKSHSSIPYIGTVDDREYRVVETDDTRGAVRIRLRLSGGSETI